MDTKIKEQLDKVEKEIDKVRGVESKAGLRLQYIKLLMASKGASFGADLEETVSEKETTYEDLDTEGAKPVEEPEEAIEEESVEEAEEVIEEQPAEKTVEEDPLDDAEMIVKGTDGEDLDISRAYKVLSNSGLTEDEKENISIYLTENNCVLQYDEFPNLAQGYERASMACALSSLTLPVFKEKVLEFAGMEDGDPFEIVSVENANELFDFMFAE